MTNHSPQHMEIAKRISGTHPWGEWGPPSYNEIFEEFGNVVVVKEIGSYQGDTLVFYDDSPMGYAFLIFGWGSCSYCDALEGCESVEDLADLIARLESQMVRFDSRHDVEKWINMREESGSWYYNKEEWLEFANEVMQAIQP